MKKDVAAPKNLYTETFFSFDDEPASARSQSDENQKESTDALPAPPPTESTTPPTPPKKPQQNQSTSSSASNSPEHQHVAFTLDEELPLAQNPPKKSLAESAPQETHSQPKQLPRNGINGSSLPNRLTVVTSQSQKIDRAQKSNRGAVSAPLDFGVSTPWDHRKVSRADGSFQLYQLHVQAKTEDDKDEEDSSSLSI